jgi:hypothetical protein
LHIICSWNAANCLSTTTIISFSKKKKTMKFAIAFFFLLEIRSESQRESDFGRPSFGFCHRSTNELHTADQWTWRAINADGTLTYTFVESVKAKTPYYITRMVGGLLYLSGMSIMLWNVIKTATSGKAAIATIPAAAAHA